ncbi:hypothetical protein QUF54_06400, partial [Candidatus Marithioploca araucensis]|nr:hypothetical protein [Candidatus Marithioploca araucensis]
GFRFTLPTLRFNAIKLRAASVGWVEAKRKPTIPLLRFNAIKLRAASVGWVEAKRKPTIPQLILNGGGGFRFTLPTLRSLKDFM